MGDALEEGNGLKREFGHDYPAEHRPEIVNASDHQTSNQQIGLEVLHGHLLVEVLELSLG